MLLCLWIMESATLLSETQAFDPKCFSLSSQNGTSKSTPRSHSSLKQQTILQQGQQTHSWARNCDIPLMIMVKISACLLWKTEKKSVSWWGGSEASVSLFVEITLPTATLIILAISARHCSQTLRWPPQYKTRTQGPQHRFRSRNSWYNLFTQMQPF